MGTIQLSVIKDYRLGAGFITKIRLWVAVVYYGRCKDAARIVQ